VWYSIPAFALSVANSDDVVTIGFLPLLEDDLSLCVEDERQPCKVRCFFFIWSFHRRCVNDDEQVCIVWGHVVPLPRNQQRICHWSLLPFTEARQQQRWKHVPLSIYEISWNSRSASIPWRWLTERLFWCLFFSTITLKI